MWKKIIDGVLDKMQTQDFWRGALYALASAGIAIDSQHAAAIVSVAMGISGALHIIWHKANPEAK